MSIFIIIIIISGVSIMLIVNYYEKKQMKLLKQIKDDEKVLYRYKDYKADGIEKYLETPEQRLARIFNSLPNKDRQKLVEYAETLERKNRNT